MVSLVLSFTTDQERHLVLFLYPLWGRQKPHETLWPHPT